MYNGKFAQLGDHALARNINYSFGNGNLSRRIIKEYSAKRVIMRVPKNEHDAQWNSRGGTDGYAFDSVMDHLARTPD